MSSKKQAILMTTTDELFLPSRIVYRVFDKNQLMKRLSGLRCMPYDESNRRWTWNYEAEAKGLGFTPVYETVPAKPLLLASCYLIAPSMLHVYVRSTLRLRKFLVFFDRQIPRTCARGEFLDQYNLLTLLDSGASPTHTVKSEDYFRDDSKIVSLDMQHLPSAIQKQELAPLTRVRLDAFYEDGEDHMVHANQLREVLATEQARSEKPIRPYEFLMEAFRKLDAGQ